MAQRWIIHSRERTLGPWTGAQVREELRAGNVDPFDMVSLENSNIKRPLVEVDEIFQSSRVQMAEIVESKPALLSANQELDETVISSRPLPLARAASDLPRVEEARPSQFQALAAENRLAAPRASAKKSGAKNYIVTDSTGKTYGPIASADVMDLWSRGILDARSIVQRKDQPRKIMIQKFVSYYDQAAPSGIAFLTRDGHSGSKFKLATMVKSQGPMTWLAGLIAIVSFGFLGFTLYQSKKAPTSNSAPKHRFDLKANEDLAGKIAPLKSNDPSKLTGTAPPNAQGLSKPTKSANEPNSRSAIVNRSQRKAIKSPIYTPNTTSRPYPPVKRQFSGELPKSYGPTPLQRTPPLEGSKRTLKPTQQIANASPEKSIKGEWTEGASVTVSSYKFSTTALSVCEGKCKIPMTGPRGPITAVFFKQAHGAAFVGKTSVSLSGIVRKTASGDWQIIVSAVK